MCTKAFSWSCGQFSFADGKLEPYYWQYAVSSHNLPTHFTCQFVQLTCTFAAEISGSTSICLFELLENLMWWGSTAISYWFPETIMVE